MSAKKRRAIVSRCVPRCRCRSLYCTVLVLLGPSTINGCRECDAYLRARDGQSYSLLSNIIELVSLSGILRRAQKALRKSPVVDESVEQ